MRRGNQDKQRWRQICSFMVINGYLSEVETSSKGAEMGFKRNDKMLNCFRQIKGDNELKRHLNRALSSLRVFWKSQIKILCEKRIEICLKEMLIMRKCILLIQFTLLTKKDFKHLSLVYSKILCFTGTAGRHIFVHYIRMVYGVRKCVFLLLSVCMNPF